VGKATIKHEVMQYLLEEKGYQKSEIKEIKSLFGKLPTFSVIVVFIDEPEVGYNYWKRPEMYQTWHYIQQGLQGKPVNPKHKESDY
jgi:hypothetical protein